MTIKQKLAEIEKLQQIEAPWGVRRIFGRPEIFGDLISFRPNGENDLVSAQDVQEAVEWIVAQLGGTVKWGKDGK